MKSKLNIVPISNWMITTSNIHKKEVYSKLFVGEYRPSFMPIQQVLAIGPRVEGVEVGDWVHIDMKRYMRTKEVDSPIKAGIGGSKKVTKEELEPPICAVPGDFNTYFKINDREIEGVVPDFDALPEDLKLHSTLEEFQTAQDAQQKEAQEAYKLQIIKDEKEKADKKDRKSYKKVKAIS